MLDKLRKAKRSAVLLAVVGVLGVLFILGMATSLLLMISNARDDLEALQARIPVMAFPMGRALSTARVEAHAAALGAAVAAGLRSPSTAALCAASATFERTSASDPITDHVAAFLGTSEQVVRIEAVDAGGAGGVTIASSPSPGSRLTAEIWARVSNATLIASATRTAAAPYPLSSVAWAPETVAAGTPAHLYPETRDWVQAANASAPGVAWRGTELSWRIDWPPGTGTAARATFFRASLNVTALGDVLSAFYMSDAVLASTRDGSVLATSLEGVSTVVRDPDTGGDRALRVDEVPGFGRVTPAVLASADRVALSGGSLLISRVAAVDNAWAVVSRVWDGDVEGANSVGRTANDVWYIELAVLVCLSTFCFLVVITPIAVLLARRREAFHIKADSVFMYDADELKMETVVGRGAFGEVWRASLDDGRVVAVKDIFVKAGSETRKRIKGFVSEASALASLQHPNVVGFVGVIVRDGNNLAIITEFMTRGSLYAVLHATSPSSYHFSLQMYWLRGIVHGLSFLHGRSILHRDLKSPNVLLGSGWEPKLADFGTVASIAEETSSHAAADDDEALGSPYWAAPEVLCSGTHSKASDVYALGIVLWEIASGGALLFPQMSAAAVAASVSRGSGLRPPSGLLPPALVDVFTACVAEDPADRPELSTINQAITDAGVPVGTHPVLPAPSDALSGRSSLAVVTFSVPAFAEMLAAQGRPFLAALADFVDFINTTVVNAGGWVVSTILSEVVAVFEQPASAIYATKMVFLGPDVESSLRPTDNDLSDDSDRPYIPSFLEPSKVAPDTSESGSAMLAPLPPSLSCSHDPTPSPFTAGIAFGSVTATRCLSAASDMVLTGPAVELASHLSSCGRLGVALVAETAVKYALALIDHDHEISIGDVMATVWQDTDVPVCALSINPELLTDCGLNVPRRDALPSWLCTAVPPSIASQLVDAPRLGHGPSTEVFAIEYNGAPAVVKRVLVQSVALDIQAELALLALASQSLSGSSVLAPVHAVIISPEIDAQGKTHTSIIRPRYDNVLADVLRGGALPVESVRTLAVSLVHALSTLSTAGLVHGNLVPSNVFLTGTGAVVADFNLMAMSASAQTMTGATRVSYLAPELLRGAAPSIVSDIYALGMLLYLALSGAVEPYPDTPPMAVVMGVLGAGLRPDMSKVPPSWCSFVSACLKSEPDARPSLDQLHASLSAMSHSDAPPTPGRVSTERL